MRTIWLTLRCNNACLFCPQRVARSAQESAFFSKEAILERIPREVAPKEPVAFVGGEPTIHPDLFDFVHQARLAAASAVVVQTNGRRLAYVSYARGLAKGGASGVDISLHGPTAAIHDYHTQTAGSFVQTLTGIGVARGAGLRVGVTSVLTRSNYRHVVDLVRLVAARGAQAIHLPVVKELPGGPAISPSLVPSREMVAPYLAEALRVAQGLGLGVLVEGGAPSPWREWFAGPGGVSPPGVDQASPT